MDGIEAHFEDIVRMRYALGSAYSFPDEMNDGAGLAGSRAYEGAKQLFTRRSKQNPVDTIDIGAGKLLQVCEGKNQWWLYGLPLGLRGRMLRNQMEVE